jgi:hypothetical protein
MNAVIDLGFYEGVRLLVSEEEFYSMELAVHRETITIAERN